MSTPDNRDRTSGQAAHHALTALLAEIIDDIEHVVGGNPGWIDRDMLDRYREDARDYAAKAAEEPRWTERLGPVVACDHVTAQEPQPAAEFRECPNCLASVRFGEPKPAPRLAEATFGYDGCLTPGAVYATYIGTGRLSVTVDYGRELPIGEDDAGVLDSALHDALERRLAPYFGTAPAEPQPAPGLSTLADELERLAGEHVQKAAEYDHDAAQQNFHRGCSAALGNAAGRIRYLIAGNEPKPAPVVTVDTLKQLALAWREKADEAGRDRASVVAYRIAARDLDEAIAAGAPQPAPELATLRELRAVAAAFTGTWAELLPDLPDSYGCELNCAEANAAADLYRALGDDATAASILAAHAAYDEEGDQHYHGPRNQP